MSCLLVPEANDIAPHIASYGFLLAIFAGFGSAARAVVRQQMRTAALLRACRTDQALPHGSVNALGSSLGLAGRLDIVDSLAPLAFCYGYLRPRIVVSRGLVGLLSREEISALLIHEREHLRQRDPLKVAVGKLLTSSVFFVPVIGALYHRYLIEKELAADAAAIATQGSSVGLTSALAALLDNAAAPRPEGAVGGDEAIEARIDALLGDRVQLWPHLTQVPLLGSVAVILLAVLPLLLAAPPAAPALSGQVPASMCHDAATPQVG